MYMRGSGEIEIAVEIKDLRHGGGLEQRGPLLSGAALPRTLVIRVSNDQRHGDRCFAEDHLFEHRVDLAPAARFLQRAAGEGAIAHVGDGDLHGVFVHRGIDTPRISAATTMSCAKFFGTPPPIMNKPVSGFFNFSCVSS